MQELDIKRGHFKKIDGKLEGLMDKHFGDVKKDGDRYVSNFGAMRPITIWLKDKATLCVEIVTVTDGVDDETAMQTIKARNEFLQEATGFTSKERSKRLQKKAKEGTL